MRSLFSALLRIARDLLKPSDALDLLVPQRLTYVNRRIITVRKDPLPVLSIRKIRVEENDGLAVSAAKAKGSFDPICLFKPAKIGWAYLKRTLAAAAFHFL